MAEIGFDISELKKGVTPLALYHILHKARGTKYELIVNNSILRSMAKAQYSANNIVTSAWSSTSIPTSLRLSAGIPTC